MVLQFFSFLFVISSSWHRGSVGGACINNFTLFLFFFFFGCQRFAKVVFTVQLHPHIVVPPIFVYLRGI